MILSSQDGDDDDDDDDADGDDDDDDNGHADDDGDDDNDDDDKCREGGWCSCRVGQLTFKMQPTSPDDWISPSSS